MIPDVKLSRIYTAIFGIIGLITITFASIIAEKFAIDITRVTPFGAGLVGGALVTYFFTLRPQRTKPDKVQRQKIERSLLPFYAGAATGSLLTSSALLAQMIWPYTTWTLVITVIGVFILISTSLPLVNIGRATIADPSLFDERQTANQAASYRKGFEALFYALPNSWRIRYHFGTAISQCIHLLFHRHSWRWAPVSLLGNLRMERQQMKLAAQQVASHP